MHIGWPQGILLVLMVLKGLHLVEYHGAAGFSAWILGSSIILALLWWGGFFG